jgi:hypothetical protein
METEGGRMRRAAATVHSRSVREGSGARAIRVPSFALKFWIITSCSYNRSVREGSEARAIRVPSFALKFWIITSC